MARKIERLGMAMLTPAAGLRALEALAVGFRAASVVAVVPFKWPAVLARVGGSRRSGSSFFSCFEDSQEGAPSQRHRGAERGLNPVVSSPP